MDLRPYQREDLSNILDAIRRERFILLQAATGAGKTILFSALIRHCMESYDMRIGVIAHREVLIRQAYDKLLKVWPEGAPYTGLACRSADKRVDVEARVVIGSPQTLAGRLNEMPPLHLLILDECHRVPPRNEKSQYRTLIERLTGYYPQLRVVGFTATPYRLGHGMIYGARCRPGKKNWWDALHYQIRISALQEQGYLVALRAKEAENIDGDLESVRTDKGEYNTADLARLMEKEVHVGSAVNAYRRYGEGRKHVVVFAVTIGHAEKLAGAFTAAGFPSGCVHSEMPQADRRRVLADFESGLLEVVCNVGVLTEGWDCTAVDCMLMCRPTLSPALYVQMIGRGLRPHPGKKDCLVLDMSGNCRRHGDPDDPHIPLPAGTQGKREKNEPRMKTCERCEELVPSAARECPACGWRFPEPEVVEIDAQVEMADVKWSPFEVAVTSCTPSAYRSRAGNDMLKLSLMCRSDSPFPLLVNHFLDIEGQASGYGQSKARLLWRRLAGTEPPETVGEAVRRAGELHMPERIVVKQNGNFLNVVRW